VPSGQAVRLRGDCAVALGIVAVIALIQLPFFRLWPSLTDEGLILQIADDLLHGHHLYRDAVHYAFPGVFYVTAAAFALLGTSVETARLLAVLVFASTCAAAYLIVRWWCSRAAALVVVIVLLCYRVWAYPHWQMLSYSTLSVTLALIATWIAGEALEGPRVWPFVTGGVVAAAALLTKQDLGAMCAAALGISIVVCSPSAPGVRRRRFLAFSLSAALALASAAVAIDHAGITRDLVREAILGPLYAVGHFDHVRRPALWPLLRQDASLRRNIFSYLPPVLYELYWPTLQASAVYQRTGLVDAALKAVYYLPWVAVVAGAAGATIGLRRNRADIGRQREFLVVALGVTFLLSFNLPQDWVHLLVLYPPTILIGAALASHLRRRRAVTAGGGILLVGFGVLSATLAIGLRQLDSAPIHSPRGTLYAQPGQALGLNAALAAVAATPEGTPVLSLPYHPLVNFLAARPGVTRYYLVWPVERNPDRDDEVIRSIEANPSAAIIYCPDQYPSFPRPCSYAPKLFGYLADHYTVERPISGGYNGFTFLLTRRSSPAGHPLVSGPGSGTDGAVARRGFAGETPVAARKAAQAEDVLWPFERVVRMSLTEGAGGKITYQVVATAGQHVAVSYGINPDRQGDVWLPPILFSASLRGLDGQHDLLRARVMPAQVAVWNELAVDLTPWAGQTVDIVLEVAPALGNTFVSDVAGWTPPRIVADPEPAR